MQEGQRTLRVAQLAAPDEVESFLEWYAQGLDGLVVFGSWRYLREIERREEVDLFIGEARRGPDPTQRLEPSGALARFFLEFSDRAVFRGFAGIDLSRRHLEDRPLGGVAVLADQDHLVRRREGNDGGGPGMANDFQLEFSAIGKLHALAVDAESAVVTSRSGILPRERGNGPKGLVRMPRALPVRSRRRSPERVRLDVGNFPCMVL